MTPEERQLLERAVKLSEENSKILVRMERRARRATIYSFIRLAIIILPLVIGYFFLEPYLNQALDNFKQVQGMINSA